MLASWLMPGCRKSQGTRPTKSAQGVSCSARKRAGAAPVAFLSASSCGAHAASVSGTLDTRQSGDGWAHFRFEIIRKLLMLRTRTLLQWRHTATWHESDAGPKAARRAPVRTQLKSYSGALCRTLTAA